MNYELIALIVFLLILCLVLYFGRKRLAIQKLLFPVLYFAMFRTKLGIKFMKTFAERYPRFVKVMGIIGIFVGFAGMIFIAYALIWNLIKMIISPVAVQGVGLVLPIKAKGIFYVPFFYWIISIFTLAIVHEFSHGVVAKRYGVKIKSSGFAFLCIIIPILPAAFVEPNEKQLVKKSRVEQLSVFAAGPLSNIILGILCALIFVFLMKPALLGMVEPAGVKVSSIMEDFNAKDSGLMAGDVIIGLDDLEIIEGSDFKLALDSKNPGDSVDVKTANATYSIVLSKSPSDETQPYMGVYVSQNVIPKGGFESGFGFVCYKVLEWLMGLFLILYLLNLGVGLFNLVPLGPIDGGRMLLVALEKFFTKEKAYDLWKTVSIIFLVLILVNIFIGFVL
jgi:Zn-dependent protease